MMLAIAFSFLALAKGDFLNVTERDGVESFTCDSADETCYIYATAACTTCTTTFNCPDGTCTECIIDCDGEDACEQSTINSFECAVVRVNALSGATTLQNAVINGPTDGDLYVTVNSSDEFSLRSAEIYGPTQGNLYVNVFGTGVDTLDVATIDGPTTGNLELNCEGDCSGSIINCPRNSASYGPSCFIYCTGTGFGCTGIEIDSAAGTPLDVKIFCESFESNLCENTEINCDENAACTMEYDNGEWSCTETACNTPTGEPTMLPSSEPSEIPSMEPTTEPSLIPSNEPSIVPSFEPTTMPSVPSIEPTGIPSTKAPSSMPIEPTEAITSTTIDTDSSPGATASTSMPSVDPGDGGGSNKDDNEAISGGIIALIAILCLVGLVIFIVIIVVCVRNKRGSSNSRQVQQNMSESQKQVEPGANGLNNEPVGRSAASSEQNLQSNAVQKDAGTVNAGESNRALEMVVADVPNTSTAGEVPTDAQEDTKKYDSNFDTNR